MQKYITLVGRSYWATLNSLWAVIKKEIFEPEEVYLLCEDSTKERADILKEDIEKLLKTYDLKTKITIKSMKDADLYHAGEEVHDIIENNDGVEVALDITGGRKSLVAGTLVNPSAKHLKHVFYLYLDDLEDADKPYPSISSERMMIKDFVDIYREE